jgi:glycyl-tRNA synthetase beta chain
MNTEHFLVEIGTEELPPRALKSLSQSFTNGVVAGLAEHQLQHGKVETFASPRRLAVSIADLQLQAEDQAVERLGPPADRARDADGNWTPAAEGFARKQGVSVDQLETVDTAKGPRLAYRSIVEGAQAAHCLPQIISDSIRALPIPKRMRWGVGRTEFVRPVHWITMLLGSEVIDCEVLGKASGSTTRGHRFHSKGDLQLAHASEYEQVLAEAKVVASYEKRRDIIKLQVEAEASKLGAEAVIAEDLLDEVTALVEWPVALAGSFEERFLQIPAEALISSMKVHQKYFHLVNAQGELLPHFITVANIESSDPRQVVDGNERVIRPRLSDADFFFTSDKKIPLEDRVEQLKSIVFQQQLGTLYDKTQRLVALAGELALKTGANENQARRAALLCKTDLLTLMVGEFPDMQGIAGRYYAINDQEPEPVAEALQQQYWPRFSGDTLPLSPLASALALADRLDTLVGIFGIGQAPSGSRDPFALRRASLGVLRIMVEGELELDLRECLVLAAANYDEGTLQADTVDQVMDYMLERFRAWYEDEAIATEVFKAVSAKKLTVPLDIHRRVHAVHAFTRLPQAPALAAANKRVSNILDKQASEFIGGEVSKDLLTDSAEVALAKQLHSKRAAVAALLKRSQYTEALASLADLQPAVDQFFDEVMVMVDDDGLRQNRLNLLKTLRDQFLQVADISLLAGSK